MKLKSLSAAWKQLKVIGDSSIQTLVKPFVPAVSVVEPVEPRVLLTASVTNGLTGEYFTGSSFQQAVLVRTDPTVNFAYVNRSPEVGIPAGAVSVRWTGQVLATFSETYTFSVRTNGGVMLLVNGQTLINDFTPHAASVDSGTIALQAGQKYSLVLEYFQTSSAGATGIHLHWQSSSTPLQIVPKSNLFTDPTVTLPGGTGLIGTYYQSEHFKNPVLTRLDPQINFNWGGGTPDVQISHIPFSITWTGEVTAKYTEPYTFYTKADDGTMLYINGSLVINDFHEHLAQLNTGQPISLVAGQEYSVVLKYFANKTPPSNVQFLWSSPSTPFQIVPSSALSSSTGAIPTPIAVAAAADSDTQITVTWAAVTGATSYLVERSTTPDGSSGFTTVGTTSNTSIVDTGLSAATTYYYRVTAISAAGNSTPSNLVAGMTQAGPAINLTAAATSDTQVNLMWNDVPNENGFIVQSSPDGSTNWTQIGTTAKGTTNFTVAGLTASTAYHYRIIAIETPTNSAPSNVATVTTEAAIPAFASLQTIYGLTSTSNSVYQIDATTGAASQIGSLSFGTSAAGRDPVSGNFYYISTGASTVQVATWNPSASPSSANTTVANSIAVTGAVTRAAFRDDGAFFFTANNGDLFQYNTTTNTATQIGTIMVEGQPLPSNNGDMAFAPDGTLFIESSSDIYTVSPSALATGTSPGSSIAGTLVGPTNTTNLQIAFGQGGVLFGYDGTGQIYTIDQGIGTATVVPSSTASGVAMGDLASVPLYANLTLNQVASTFASGSNGTYTLTLNNAGPDGTTGPTAITDTLPAGLTFVSATGTGWTFNNSGQTVTMEYGGNIAANSSAPAVTLTVAVSSAAKPSVTNTAVISSNIFNTNTANNTSTLMTSVS